MVLDFQGLGSMKPFSGSVSQDPYGMMMMQMEVPGVVTSCWILSVIDVVKRLTVGSCQ